MSYTYLGGESAVGMWVAGLAFGLYFALQLTQSPTDATAFQSTYMQHAMSESTTLDMSKTRPKVEVSR